jgi:hypothetical protein
LKGCSPKSVRPRSRTAVGLAPAGRPGYSWPMQEEGAVLEELMGHLREASGSIRAARRLLAEHASEEDPAHLRLLARLSEALDATETASREARRQRGIG